MNLHLFPYPGADGNKSDFVRSTTSAEVAQVRDFKCYEQPTIRFKPVEQLPSGPYNARTAAFVATGYTAVAFLYTEAAGAAPSVLATTPTMTWDASGYFDGVLDLNTSEAIAATAALAAGSGLAVRFCFVLFDGSGQPTIVEQGVRLFNTPPPNDLPDPTSVTTTIFANLLEAGLGDSNTITWRRPTGNVVYGDVPIMGAPGIIPAMSLQMPVGGPYAAPEETAVVLGVAGERYVARLNIVLHCELSLSTGGFKKPGDHAQFLRGTSVPSDVYNRITLSVDSPPGVYLLNYREAGSQAITDVDYFAEILVDSGATLTLTVDTTDPLTFPLLQTVDVTLESASQVQAVALGYQAASASAAGNTDIETVADKRHHSAVLTADAGAGTYTHTLALLTADRQAGDVARLRLVMPASANPTIEVRDATSGGTLLATIVGAATGAGAGVDYIVVCVFDGTAWYLDSVAPDASSVLAARTQGRETIWVPAGAMTSRTTDGPASGTAETTTNKVMQRTLNFDPDTTQYAQFEVAMPKCWNRGTVAAEFLWQAAAGSGVVRWGIQGRAFGDADAMDAAFGTAAEVNDTLGTVDTLRISPESAAVTIAGSPASGDMVVFQVYREAADAADTLAELAKLKGVRLFYTTNAANDD